MTRSFFDFIIEVHEKILSNPEYIFILEFLIIFLILIIIILIVFIYYMLKNNQIQPNNVTYFHNTYGIKEQPEKTVLNNFEYALRLINSNENEKIILGLEYLKYHPNPISLQKIGEKLSSENVSDDVKEKALNSLKYITKHLD